MTFSGSKPLAMTDPVSNGVDLTLHCRRALIPGLMEVEMPRMCNGHGRIDFIVGCDRYGSRSENPMHEVIDD